MIGRDQSRMHDGTDSRVVFRRELYLSCQPSLNKTGAYLVLILVLALLSHHRSDASLDFYTDLGQRTQT